MSTLRFLSSNQGVTFRAAVRYQQCTEMSSSERRATSVKRSTRLSPTDQRDTDEAKHAGFEEAYLAHRAAIYGHVRRMVLDEVDAEDLTVTVFEKALRAWERRPPEGELRPWLFRIATNACLDELRKRQRIQWRPWDVFISLFHPSQVAPDDPEREVLRHEKADLMHSALARLSPRDRAALVMRECYGLSNDEVGHALGTTRDGAKMTLFRARERLRSIYLQMGGEPPEGARSAAPRPARADRSAIPAKGDPRVMESRG